MVSWGSILGWPVCKDFSSAGTVAKLEFVQSAHEAPEGCRAPLLSLPSMGSCFSSIKLFGISFSFFLLSFLTHTYILFFLLLLFKDTVRLLKNSNKKGIIRVNFPTSPQSQSPPKKANHFSHFGLDCEFTYSNHLALLCSGEFCPIFSLHWLCSPPL